MSDHQMTIELATADQVKSQQEIIAAQRHMLTELRVQLNASEQSKRHYKKRSQTLAKQLSGLGSRVANLEANKARLEAYANDLTVSLQQSGAKLQNFTMMNDGRYAPVISLLALYSRPGPDLSDAMVLNEWAAMIDAFRKCNGNSPSTSAHGSVEMGHINSGDCK